MTYLDVLLPEVSLIFCIALDISTDCLTVCHADDKGEAAGPLTLHTSVAQAAHQAERTAAMGVRGGQGLPRPAFGSSPNLQVNARSMAGDISDRQLWAALPSSDALHPGAWDMLHSMHPKVDTLAERTLSMDVVLTPEPREAVSCCCRSKQICNLRE